MVKINPQSGTPIYLQIIEQLRHAVALGVYRAGDALPTIRELALQLQVNPNTVARAIRELEREGLLITRVGKGSFVSEQAPQGAVQDQLLKGKQQARQFGKDMRWLGFDCLQAQHLVSENWEEDHERDD